ncbi:hypothetical protein GCM10029976_087510 [Kribbella albertanoniae]
MSPPPLLRTVTEYGTDYDLRRWSDELRTDPRWDSRYVVAWEKGKAVGCLPIWRSALPAPPSTFLIQQLATMGLSADQPYLHLGGHSRLIGGATVVARADRWATEECLGKLISAACSVATDLRIRPVAQYVPHAQLPAFLANWPTRPQVTAADVFSRLDLRWSPVGEPQHRLKRVRQQWKRDTRDLRELHALGLRSRWTAVSRELIAEAGPLVAAVAERNGRTIDHRLAGYEITKWWRFEPASATALSIRDGAGRLLGVTFARRHESALELYEVGMADTFADRRSLYASLGFTEPMRFCLDAGLTVLELGVGHPVPKQIRGAQQEPLWHLS